MHRWGRMTGAFSIIVRTARWRSGPSRMAPAHCRHGWSVVVRTTSRRPRNGSRASTFVSAWASAEPNISPGGPSASFTRLRAEQTISPPGVEEAGTHRDVPGSQRFPRLAERLLPRLIQSRPDPCRSTGTGGRGISPHESRPTPAQATCVRARGPQAAWHPVTSIQGRHGTPRRRPQQRQDVSAETISIPTDALPAAEARVLSARRRCIVMQASCPLLSCPRNC